MERSVSCAERSSAFKPAAPAIDLRSHSASYAARYAPAPTTKPPPQQLARSNSSWSRPAAAAVQRSGSTKSVSGGPTPGLNLRCYSASYAASYDPFSDAAGGPAQAKAPGTTAAAAWCSAGRRSLNLRGYTPSFAALVDDDPAPAPKSTAAADDAEAEMQRKKRLVAYKVFDVEGKVKLSVRRSVKWIKGKYSRAVYGV